MSKTFKLQRVEYHHLNRYYEASITEDEIRLILNRADVSEDDQDELLSALADADHERNGEVWEILYNDDYFNDYWECTEEDCWTDRKGGYDQEDTCEEVIEDGDDSDSAVIH